MSPEALLSSPQSSCRWRIDARSKLLAALALVISIVTVPLGHWTLLGVHSVFVLTMVALSGVSLIELGKRLLVILPLLFVVTASAPFMTPASATAAETMKFPISSTWMMVLTVGGRALLAVTVITLLMLTTPFRDLLKAFEQLRFPQVLVQTIALAWRYLFLLIDEARSIHRAVVSRGFRGRWIWQATTVGRMIGALLLRSLERSERVHHAMMARSAYAVRRRGEASPVRLSDALFAVSIVAMLVSVRVIWMV